VLWLNVSGGVRGSTSERWRRSRTSRPATVRTTRNVTPDGDHLLIASGGTTGMAPEGDENHAIFRVDADRDSDTFGEVTAQIETGYVGPCDMTLGPTATTRSSSTWPTTAIRVLTVDPFETVARVGSGEPVTEGNVLPFMCTAAFDGESLLVENGEGTLGGDPEVPREGSESCGTSPTPRTPRRSGRSPATTDCPVRRSRARCPRTTRPRTSSSPAKASV